MEPHGQSPWYLLVRPWGGILSESLDSALPRSGRVLSWPKDEPTAGGRGASRRIEKREGARNERRTYRLSGLPTMASSDWTF